jgi:hypothetical protein
MPVPQRMNFFVEQASCPPLKDLLIIVQDVISNLVASEL